ncbi:MAG: DedA family protein [Desulfatiglandales bacterium]
MEEIILWIVEKIGQMGYGGIIALMFLESSFFPFPSEVVMPPAGYLASQGKMSLGLCIFSGIFGSVLGAIFNYYVAVRWGRAILLKYGKYVLLTERSLNKAEEFFDKHGPISTFVGRLLPGIRQYISLPAGLLRMSIPKFLLYTGLGSGIWVSILTVVGYIFGENQETLRSQLNSVTIYVIIACCLILGAYVFILRFKKRRRGL